MRAPRPPRAVPRQPAGCARVIKMNVRQENIRDVVDRQIVRLQRGFQGLDGRTGAAFDQNRAMRMLDEIRRDDLWDTLEVEIKCINFSRHIDSLTH